GEGDEEGLRAGLVDRLRDRGADVRARIEAGFVLGRLGDPRFPEHAGPFGAYRLPEMVAFGGGASAMGGDAELEHLGYLYTAHRPRHAVALAPFALGRYPVTVAEWGCFVAAGGYDDDRWWDTPAGRAWRRGEGTRAGGRANMRRGLGLFGADPALLEDYHATGQIHDASYARWRRWLALSPEAFEADLVAEFPDERYAAPRTWDDPRHSGPNQPVTGISWFEARAYCAWLAAQTGRAFRLPTEAEWEHAAAGAAGRRFAYGDAFDPLAANTHAAHVRQPSPVGAFPTGDTPEGLVDMTGNVYEWTASAWGRHDEAADFSYPYDPADGREAPDLPDDVRRVMRGGSWNDPALQAHAVYRGFDHPGGRGPDYGMRLACG
ncbi:MAG: hypothetical protein DYG90_13300, partial [Chloroflexi bacterium CFX6]|nr:hypothetical protein [Chloroflexi bacterium CFX6]